MNGQGSGTHARHIHLSGICGTAMASLAGLLQLQGHRITGSDKAAYPPMSDLLRALGIAVMEPYAEAQSRARARSGRHRQCALARQSGDRARARRAHSLHLHGGSAARGVSHGPRVAGRCRNARQDDDDQHAGLDLSDRRAREPGAGAVVSDRRRGGELRHQLSTAPHAHVHRRGRRVRHGLLRQGPEVPALLSRRADSDPRRVRSRRHLCRSGSGEDCLQAAGESGSAARPDRRLRRQRQRD